jgi:hypothetical protein
MTEPRTIAQLFEEEPYQWGLRGDPYLWRRMREHFAATPLPAQLAELDRQIEHAFLELTGQPLSAPEPFFVEAFAHGGMSSGLISPEFWREQALPLLRARYSP